MKVELGIVTRRQTMGGGGGGSGAAGGSNDGGRNRSPTGMKGKNLSLGLGLSIQTTGTGGTERFRDREASNGSIGGEGQEAERPSSPSALSSAFPTSPHLVSSLQQLPLPYPPARETGMGFSTSTTTTAMDRSLSLTSSHSHQGRHTPTRTDSYGSDGSYRLNRKTSSDSMTDGESEFQRELRLAKEELEGLAVKEMRDKEVMERDRLKTKKAGEGIVGDGKGLGFVGNRFGSSSMVTPITSPFASNLNGGTSSSTSRRGAPRPTGRSAAFFGTPSLVLRPPGLESSRQSGSILRPPPPFADPVITPSSSSIPTPPESSSPVPISSVSSYTKPAMNLSLPPSPYLSTKSTNSTGKPGLPIHSPLPERDPSPRSEDARLIPEEEEEPSLIRPQAIRRVSSTTIKERTKAGPGGELKPPSPILAPFC